jgi:hypothetical protein
MPEHSMTIHLHTEGLMSCGMSIKYIFSVQLTTYEVENFSDNAHWTVVISK